VGKVKTFGKRKEKSRIRGVEKEKTKRNRKGKVVLMEYDLKVLNLGAGVDSSAMLLASEFGLWGVPKVDFAVYLDTGADPHWVKEQIEKLKGICKTPIHIVKGPRPLREVVLDPESVVAIPCYTEPRGMGGRQCTELTKLRWIKKHIREECGVQFRQRMRKKVVSFVGIDADEKRRAKNRSEGVWTVDYPLVTAGKGRQDCRNLIRRFGLGIFHRSSCIFCPLHKKKTWCSIAMNATKEEFEEVKKVDRGIRNQYLEQKGVKQYLHYRRDAIEEIDWKKEYETLEDSEKRGFEEEWGA